MKKEFTNSDFDTFKSEYQYAIINTSHNTICKGNKIKSNTYLWSVEDDLASAQYELQSVILSMNDNHVFDDENNVVNSSTGEVICGHSYNSCEYDGQFFQIIALEDLDTFTLQRMAEYSDIEQVLRDDEEDN